MTGRLATIARAGRWRGARWFGLKGAPAAPAAAGRDKVGRKSDPTRLSLAPA
jgi:hypothetical protein